MIHFMKNAEIILIHLPKLVTSQKKAYLFKFSGVGYLLIVAAVGGSVGNTKRYPRPVLQPAGLSTGRHCPSTGYSAKVGATRGIPGGLIKF